MTRTYFHKIMLRCVRGNRFIYDHSVEHVPDQPSCSSKRATKTGRMDYGNWHGGIGGKTHDVKAMRIIEGIKMPFHANARH